jgi:peptidyl-prolyl cis-trans isomerase A (cyclophilin A)
MKNGIIGLSIGIALTVVGCGGGPEPAEKAPPAEPSLPATAAEGTPAVALYNPALAREEAPAQFQVKFETTKGDFVMEVHRDWAPGGADRFYNLVRIGYYDDVAFFRVIDGFMAQFGIHGDARVNRAWRDAEFADDPVRQSNMRGFVSFATAGPNSRTTQLFINSADNANLDRMGFSPFAKIVQGMEVVASLYSDYGEGAPQGQGPNQELIQREGNAYLKSNFPNLDFIVEASLVEPTPAE